jgi:hypothetical protein
VQEEPRKNKEKSLHFLVFPSPNRDFSMGFAIFQGDKINLGGAALRRTGRQ